MKLKNFTPILLITLALIWACNQSDAEKKANTGNEQNTKQEQVKTTNQQAPPTGEVDEYGRKPGDEHYGHNHAPQDNSQQGSQTTTKQATPTGGEPDKFGRKPGDEHYGHDHQ